MASREEHAAILRRYYPDNIVNALMAGTVRSGLAGGNLSSPSRPHQAHCLHRAQLRNARKRLRRVDHSTSDFVFTEREARALHAMLHKMHRADAVIEAERWNRFFGRGVVVIDDYDIYIESGSNRFVECWGYAPGRPTSRRKMAAVLHRRPAFTTSRYGPYVGSRDRSIRVEDYFAEALLRDRQYGVPDTANEVQNILGVTVSSGQVSSIYVPKAAVVAEFPDVRMLHGVTALALELGLDGNDVVVRNELVRMLGVREDVLIICKLDGGLPQALVDKVQEGYMEELDGELGAYHSSHGVLRGDAEGTRSYTYGVEWEVDPIHNDRACEHATLELPRRNIKGATVRAGRDAANARVVNIHQVKRVFARASGTSTYIHAESDSSLPNGYEWVTAYRPYEGHMRILDAAEALDETMPWMETMEGAENGGIHVHVSRRRGDGSYITGSKLVGISNFICNIDNNDFIRRMTGRYVECSRWVKRPHEADRRGLLGTNVDPDDFWDYAEGVFATLEGHYYAVNVRSNTIEFRCFNSGGVHAVRHALQFVDSIMHFIDTIDRGELLIPTVEHYMAFIETKKGRWPSVEDSLYAWCQATETAAQREARQTQVPVPMPAPTATEILSTSNATSGPLDMLLHALYPETARGDVYHIHITPEMRRELVREVVNRETR